MGNIIYSYDSSIYLNITNKCCCSCTFCIRNQNDSLGSANSLWHEKEPSLDEIISDIDNFDWSNYTEVVFCGFGEPTCALDKLVATAKYIKKNLGLKIRLNTNGLSDLINKKPTAKLLCEYIDEVSISLNAPTPELYLEVTRSVFGECSFKAMLDFACDCKKHFKVVRLSVVDTLSKEDIEACKKLAKSVDIPLRIRKFI